MTKKSQIYRLGSYNSEGGYVFLELFALFLNTTVWKW